MKLCDLKFKRTSAWPPQWASAYEGADELATGDEGVLTGVRTRQDGGLEFTMEYEGRSHTGVLLWDEPPVTTDRVAERLRASAGRPIRDLYDLDL